MINIDNLVIEVTRRCNMCCEHCLRGESQNLDINLTYIDQILTKVGHISNITFSGGEPSLNVKAIEHTLEVCEKNNIDVGSFYIVTNGKENLLPLTIASLKWFAYAYEKDICGLALSKDMFHESISNQKEEFLRGLSFFREDKFTDFNKIPLITEGRAAELSGFKTRPLYHDGIDIEVYDDELSVNSLIYLSANGDIKINCDAAYENDDFTIGNICENTFEEILGEYVEETTTT